MTGQNTSKNANKVKMALIPLLCVALIYLVFASRGKPKSPQKLANGQTVATATATSSTESNALPNQLAVVPPRPWPSRSLDEILHFDPFESLAPEVSPSEKEPANPPLREEPSKQDHERTQLVEIYSQKVPEMVLHSRNGSFAVIEGKTIREGDVLDGGVRVVAIRADEILFELLETE